MATYIIRLGGPQRSMRGMKLDVEREKRGNVETLLVYNLTWLHMVGQGDK